MSEANFYPELSSVLSYYNTSLALLLRISQPRLGATHILNAGLLQAVRHSQLFSADPDIGLGTPTLLPRVISYSLHTEMENPDALKKFFDLMLAVLRIINSVMLSRGHQNDQTIKMGREFLAENRLSMVAIFKRNANVGGLKNEKVDLGDLIDQYTLLISATGFLEVRLFFLKYVSRADFHF